MRNFWGLDLHVVLSTVISTSIITGNTPATSVVPCSDNGGLCIWDLGFIVEWEGSYTHSVTRVNLDRSVTNNSSVKLIHHSCGCFLSSGLAVCVF